MHKFVLLLTILLLVGVTAGCASGGEAASPISSPPPSPTSVSSTSASAAPTTVAVVPSGPASCELSPVEFPSNPNIPPVSEADHTEGPDDASITFIEYADFQ